MEDHIGNFESNKEADFIVIDLKATELIARTNLKPQIILAIYCLI